MSKRKSNTATTAPEQPAAQMSAAGAGGASASTATAPLPQAAAPTRPTQPAPSGSGQTGGASGNGPQTQRRKPSHDEIARRAFEIWVAKGRPTGQDAVNWSQAERELAGGR